MKLTKKKVASAAIIGLGALLLSSCTSSFCTSEDYANMLYPYEQGVTIYCTKEEYLAYKNSDECKAIVAYDKANGTNGKYASLFDSLSGPAFVDSNGNVLNDSVYKYVPFSVANDVITFTANKASEIKTIITTATSTSSSTTYAYVKPSAQYWAAMDQYTLEATVVEAAYDAGKLSKAYSTPSDFATLVEKDKSFISDIVVSFSENASRDTTKWCVNPYEESNPDESKATPISIDYDGKGNSLLRYYGELKFDSFKSDDYLDTSNYAKWIRLLRAGYSPLYASGVNVKDGLGLDGTMSSEFLTLYRSTLVALINNKKSCISTSAGTQDTYGHYGTNGNWAVPMTSKNWGDAWNKGFLEGLLVYPIAWMVDTFAYGLGGLANGTGQILAIIFVTLIVRVVMLLLTMHSTISQQRMTALQPQLAKIQAKYPNANTNQSEKQRLAQETQALYKRNKVSMVAPFITLIFQFPIFICVWDAMNGSAVLSTGYFLNMDLSATIQSLLSNFSDGWATNAYGWWTTLILYILMAAGQFLAVFIPQLIQKKRSAGVSKMYKNPAASQQGKQTKLITYGMVIMMMVTGFFLPSAMGVYWFIGGLISLAQSLITQLIISKTTNKKGERIAK